MNISLMVCVLNQMRQKEIRINYRDFLDILDVKLVCNLESFDTNPTYICEFIPRSAIMILKDRKAHIEHKLSIANISYNNVGKTGVFVNSVYPNSHFFYYVAAKTGADFSDNQIIDFFFIIFLYHMKEEGYKYIFLNFSPNLDNEFLYEHYYNMGFRCVSQKIADKEDFFEKLLDGDFEKTSSKKIYDSLESSDYKDFKKIFENLINLRKNPKNTKLPYKVISENYKQCIFLKGEISKIIHNYENFLN